MITAAKYKQLEVGMKFDKAKANEWAQGDNVYYNDKWGGYDKKSFFGEGYNNNEIEIHSVHHKDGINLFRTNSSTHYYVKADGFLEFMEGKRVINLITNINTQTNEQIIVPRKKASITTGQRPEGTVISGKASRATITVRPLTYRAAIGY